MKQHKIVNKLPDLDPQSNKKPEDKSIKKLSNYRYIEDLIYYYSKHNIFIKLKICQRSIRASNSYYPLRHGRFALDEDEHKALLNNGGCYLFIVENGGGVVRAQLIRADHITFINQITWTKVLNGP